MDFNWKILNISPTEDKEAVRRAYMAQLSNHNPEDDPEGFALLREAYEKILTELDNPAEKTPLDLFMQRVEEVYADFERRCDIDEWKTLLSDDVCIRLDLEDETSERILVFLMEKHYLPKRVWILLNNHFSWTSKTSTLKQNFPANYLDFVIFSTKYENLNYDLFVSNILVDGEQYDRFIWLYYEMESHLHMSEDSKFLEMKAEIEMLPLQHVYYDLLLARMHILLGDTQKAICITSPIFEKLSDDARTKYAHALALLANDKAEEARSLFEEILEENPKDLAAQKALIETLLELEDYEEARLYLLDILDKYPYNPFALHVFRVVTERLITIYEERYQQNPDEETTLNLAKHYLNGYMFDKCKEILDAQYYENPRYYEYLADCYANIEDFKEAIELFEINITMEKTYRNYVKFARALIDAGQLDRAIATIDEALLLEDSDTLSKAYLYDNRGFALHKLQQYERAIDDFDKAIEINSQSAHIYIHKAESYQKLHRYGEAISCCEMAILIFPYTTEAYTIQMEIFYDSDLFDRIITLADEADAVGFDSPRVRYHKACALRMLDKLDEAEKILDELIDSDFDEGYRDFFHAESAYLATAKNDYKKALYHITKAIEISDDYPYRHVFLGNIHRILQNFEESLEVYNQILARFSNYTYALLGRGDTYFDLNNYDLARNDYKAALKINENIERAYNQIIDTYLAEGRLAKAINWAKRVLELFESANNYLRLAHCLSLQEQFEDALAILDKCETMYPDELHDIIIRRGLIFDKLDLPQDAIDSLLKGVEALDKKDSYWNMPYIYSTISLLYANHFNDVDNAIKYCQFALELDDKLPMAIKIMGDLLYSKQDYKGAATLYEQAIDLNQNDPSTYIARAQVYRYLKKYLRANRDYKKALVLLQSQAENAYGYTQMAICYVGLGKYAQARKMFDEVLETSTIWVDECYYGLGLIFERQKNYKKALEYYTKALEKVNSIKYNFARDRVLSQQ